MLQNPTLKAEFFTSIDSALIFQKERFLDFLKLRILDSSYTKFANKIGLSLHSYLLKNALLKGQAKVALNFPYKDCVLKGAQSKDSDKSDEIFFNEILASDEIDILFKPKALCNFEKYAPCHSEGVSPKNPRIASDTFLDSSPSLKNDEFGDLDSLPSLKNDKIHNLKSALQNKPNLLIKGNNLLALHTLKSRRDIYGQVKLIYIDPPYNTGNDSFNYNDRFNHSAWLVFMKNRLEIAREFLREDGVIFIQCDDNEQAYLKVLCDEIFGRENFVCTLHIELSTTQGMKVAAAQKGQIVKNAEYILVYSKKMENFAFKRSLYMAKEWDDHYSIYINPQTRERNTLLNFLKDKYQNISKQKIVELYEADNTFRDFIHKNAKNIYRDAMIDINFDFTEQERQILDSGKILTYKDYQIFKTSTGVIRQLLSLEKAIGDTDDFESKFGLRKIRGDWWSGFYKDMMNINKEANLVWKAGKKPERLIKDILELATKEGDLVMDFFAGSGTTCAVAHKMNRRWIGIEQMHYVEGITKERLIKVINGEQGGISKAVGWNPLSPSLAEGKLPKNESLLDCHTERSEVSQDSRDFSHSTNAQNDKNGDILTFSKPKNDKNVKSLELPKNEFIYCELMPLNALYKEKIAKSSSESELARIYDELQTKAFIDYRVDIKEMLKDRDFEALPLADKRKILYAILDSNMDYVAYSDIQDSNFCVDKEVQELNRAFFEGGENG